MQFCSFVEVTFKCSLWHPESTFSLQLLCYYMVVIITILYEHIRKHNDKFPVDEKSQFSLLTYHVYGK